MTRTVLASVAVLLLAAPAAEAKRCSQLRGRDLAPAKAVRLVQRPNAEQGKDLLGCALPHGKVRRLASSADHDTNVESFRIRQVAGEKVLLDTAESSQYGEEHSTGVTDIRSGRSYNIVFDCYVSGSDCPDAKDPGVNVTAARINRYGQAAVLLSTGDLVGFSSQGFRSTLDSGAPGEIEALKLDNMLVSWRHSGELKTFALDG